jgi:UDP-3-O-[3-hydroxymyristoyl] glucosamine N-acyltransferase
VTRKQAKPVGSSELADWLGGKLVGECRLVTRLVPPTKPAEDGVAVAGTTEFLKAVKRAHFAALVVPEKTEGTESQPIIQVPDTRLALALLSLRFDDRPQEAAGVHPTATIHPTAHLAKGVHVGAGTVIGPHSKIGMNTFIGPGCVIGHGSQLGEKCRLFAKVVIYDGVRLGDEVYLHSGAIIGADGFGYAVSPKGVVKIHHLAGVTIGNNVEVGANSSIDRGTLDDTRIGDRCKIDNNCFLSHNIQIGNDTIIAGNTGIGGSARIGSRVLIGGGATLADHVSIGDDARISFCAAVTKDVPPGETFSGFPAMSHQKFTRRLYLLGRLERIWQGVKSLGSD